MTAETVTGAFLVEREVRVQAPRERVFELLSSREGLALWMPVRTLEPRIGGNVEFRFVHERGSEAVAFGEITAYDPPARIAFTWDFKNDPLDARTEVTFDLIAEGEATLVRLTHTGFVDEEERSKHDEGWAYWIGSLKTRGEGQDPGDDRHMLALRHADALAALRAEEIALRDQIERVAASRRRVPLGAPIGEYTFRGADGAAITLAELFGDESDLLVYHFMFAPDDGLPCSMCSMWIDGFNAVAPHVRDRAEFVVVAKAPIDKLNAWAQQRGWDNIRVLSSFESTFNRDFHAEDPDGDQVSSISVFRRNGDNVHHFYQKFASTEEDGNRGIDLLSPVWNLFDLLPDGRGDWYPSHAY
jgi:predicted dithiol-disulfide oxidoreductase (DUF899 family)/uncharacterized protein YndB with AHSA1/START domain